MNTPISIRRKLHFRRGRCGSRQLATGAAAPKPTPLARIPRVARLMALAIRFEQLVRDGQVADYADIARLGCISRARVTQIMNLLNLAPDIQGAILFLPAVERGRDPCTEVALRAICAEPDWRRQRVLWAQIVA